MDAGVSVDPVRRAGQQKDVLPPTVERDPHGTRFAAQQVTGEHLQQQPSIAQLDARSRQPTQGRVDAAFDRSMLGVMVVAPSQDFGPRRNIGPMDS
jgi:hypothetical protein